MKHETIGRLREMLLAIAPISEMSVGQFGNAATVFVNSEHQAAVQSTINAFDWSDAATQAWLDAQKPERNALRQAAAQAVADNDTYLAIATPSNAQVVAQVRRLTQQMNKLIPFVAKQE